MGSRPPLAGYNHNIRYGERVYHVQTEESGLDNPHIFTHLFLGGMVICSARTEYSHLLSQADCDEKVRKLMQDQHKRLMKELRRGDYDDKIIALVGSVKAAEGEVAIVTPAQAGIEAEPPPVEMTIEAEVAPPAASPAVAPTLPAVQAVPPAGTFPPAAAALAAGRPAGPAPAGIRKPDLPPAPVAETTPGNRQPTAIPRPSRVGLPPVPDAGVRPGPSEDSRLSRQRRAPIDETKPYADETAARSPAQSARAGAQPAQPGAPALEVSVTERPYQPRSELEIEITEKVDMREAVRRSTRAPGARPPSSAMSPVAPRRPPSQSMPPLPRLPSDATQPTVQRRPPTGTVPAVPRRRPPSDTQPPLQVLGPQTPLPALPRISRPGLPTAPRPGQPARAQGESVSADRPATDDATVQAPAPLITPTFYSKMRRAQRASEEISGPRQAPAAGPSRAHPSRVFGKPVPGAAPQLPAVEERTPVDQIPARRSGVYPIPGLGGPGPERPHPDPNVRAARSSPAASYGSTPQRYTAPSRPPAAGFPKRRSPTGTYERPGWNRAGSPGARAGTGTEPRLPMVDPRPGTGPRLPTVEALPGKPRQPAGPSMKPLPRAGRPASMDSPSQGVIARPAVMVGERTGQRAARGDRPSSALVEPLRGAPRPRSPAAAPTPTGAARQGQRPRRPSSASARPVPTPSGPAGHRPPSSPGSMFGAGLITERSLDEVILSYLAEDVDSDD